MNAFTSIDYTMYPFATTNAQDFKNLMGVYLDATLRPLLKQADFVQEGWRIGPENPSAKGDEPGQDLTFKGVVYNEMKGQMSDASYIYSIRWLEHMFPSLNNFGGDPQKMTNLTYEQLKAFHQAHYHPSNSKIVTYGDQPVEGHLEMLSQQLDQFAKVDVDRDLKMPIELNEPSYVSLPGPVDPLTPANAQYKTSTTWLMGDATDIHESFALQIATSILMDGYGSPLYRALIESGLGTDFSPNTGYDTSTKKAIFSIGLNGVTEENVPKVREAVVESLKEVVSKGFEQHKIDGLLHQLELGLKHKTARFGLSRVRGLIPGWFNGIDPFEALQWNSVVEHFKTEYAKPGYLEGLIEKYLLNDNYFTFTMVPTESFGPDTAAEEASRLKDKIVETVKQFPSEEEAHKHLRERELELVEEQTAGQTQSLDSLPTLHVSDIPRQQKSYPVRESKIDQTAVQWRETATNGLTYFRAFALFKDLPDELRMLVPLFCDSLMRIGTKDKSMEELEDLIKLKTGGVSFGYHTKTSPFDLQKAEEGLSLSGYAFDGNVSAMYELLQTILIGTDFDSPQAQKMIKQLLQTSASSAVDDIASSGHAYARNYAIAGLSPQGKYAEQTGGLTQAKLITSLAAAEESPEVMGELVSKLKAIQSLAVSNLASNARVALTCGAEATSSNERALQNFLTTTASSALPTPTLSLPSDPQHFPTPSRTLFTLPYQVSYSALALPTAPYTSQQSAPFAILAQLLTHKHLHHEIREKGGAYGGGAFSAGDSGVFGMYSYRDPNPGNTLAIMRDAGRWAREREWSERELEEAKLSVFQRVDAPISVNSEGMTRFLSGIDEEMEQRRREWLLDVDSGQVREAAERLDREVRGEGKGNMVLLGERKGFVREEEGWTVMDMGLAAANPAGEGVEGEVAAAS